MVNVMMTDVIWSVLYYV